MPRPPDRLIPRLPLLLGLALAMAATPADAQPDLKAVAVRRATRIEAGIGYARFHPEIKGGMWYPIWAEIESRDRDLTGRLIFRQEGSPQTVEIPFDVPGGTTKRYFSRFRVIEGIPLSTTPMIEVTVDAPGIETNLVPVPVNFAAARSQHILVIGEEMGPLGFLSDRPSRDFLPTGDTPPNRIVIAGDVDYLPRDPIALEPLDAIILSGSQVARITRDQWTAIRQWVEMGGVLMLAGGPYQSFIKNSPLDGAFGIEFTEPEAASWGDILIVPPGEEIAGEQLLVSWPREKEPGAASRVRLGDAAHPLIVRKDVGRGRFYAIATSFNAYLFVTLEGFGYGSPFWWEMLARRHHAGELMEIARRGENLIGLELQRGFNISVAGVKWVFLYLLFYHVLALPVNWWVCKRLKRPAWAWAGVIVLGFGFAGYGYRSGLKNQQSDFQVNEVTFVSRAAEGSPARATSIATVFSPARMRRTLDFPAGTLPSGVALWQARSIPVTRTGSGIVIYLVNEVTFSPQRRQPMEDLYSESPLAMRLDGESRVEEFFLFPFSTRNLRTDYMMEGGGIEVAEPIREATDSGSADGGGGRFEGRLTNRTGWTFEAFQFHLGSRVLYGASPWPDGESLDVSQLQVLEAGAPPAQFVTAAIQGMFGDRAIDPLYVSGGYAVSPQARIASRRPSPRDPSTDLDTFVSAFRDYLNRNASRPPGLQFVGYVGDGAPSPVADLMNADKRITRLFYEEDLTRALAPVDPGGQAPAPIEWSLRFGGGIDFAVGEPIPLRRIELEWTPTRALWRDATPGAWEVRLALAASPDPDHAFATGVAPGFAYRLIGCPLQVYNFRSGAWEDLGPWIGEREAIAITPDRLHPEHFSIQLRLDARPGELLYAPSGTINPDGPVKKGGELSPVSHLVTPRQAFLRFGNQSDYVSLQIIELEVRRRR